MVDVFKVFIQDYAELEKKSEDEYAQKVLSALSMLEQSFFLRLGGWFEIHPARFHIEKKSPKEGRGWYFFSWYGDLLFQNNRQERLRKPYLSFHTLYLPSDIEPFHISIQDILSPAILDTSLKERFIGKHKSFLQAITFLVGAFVKASNTNLRVKHMAEENASVHNHHRH